MSLTYRITSFALLFLLGCCFMATTAQMPERQEVDEASQEAMDPTHIMAIVNGKSLTAGQLDEWSEILSPKQVLTTEQRRLQALHVLVNLQAFVEAAIAEKLDETQEFKKRMELMRESILQQLYIDRRIMTPVSDSELKSHYKREITTKPKELEIHARHILVKSKEEATDLIKKLEKGDDFEKLAQEKSTDDSASIGGDLGYFTKGQMVKPFEEAAFSLKAGEYSTAPVETQFGWHVIKVEDVRQKEPPTFDEAKPYLQNLIIRQRYKDLQRNVLAGVSVSYPDETIAKAMEQFLGNEEEIDEFEDQ